MALFKYDDYTLMVEQGISQVVTLRYTRSKWWQRKWRKRLWSRIVLSNMINSSYLWFSTLKSELNKNK